MLRAARRKADAVSVTALSAGQEGIQPQALHAQRKHALQHREAALTTVEREDFFFSGNLQFINN
jgi:hypothetical protein